MSSFIIPNQIQAFLRHLESAGYQGYLVGGCVRDGLLNLAPHDWDVCTDALPQELLALFPNALTYGMRHGTVTVNWYQTLIEVTTFRSEDTYSDHRRPDHVAFIKDLRTDLARRDFTINAIAMDADARVHDPFGGVQDLHAGIIRAVGLPEERFREDALRMLRAIRFSAQLGFSIDSKTRNAIVSCSSLATSLSAERVSQEVEKTLLTANPERISEMIMSGLLKQWLAESIPDHPEKLKRIKCERIHRWCGFSLMMQNEEMLNLLRLDRKTIEVCSRCLVIRKQENRDIVFWKQTIHQYGREIAQIASEVLSSWDKTNDEQIMHSILKSGECCTVSELAISGSDVQALGFSGKEIGTALETALRHVWRFPDQNECEILLSYLREEL